MVPLMVVAFRISVPAIIGRLPSSANATMAQMPIRIGLASMARPASIGSSCATDFASDENVESRVEPAALIITTVITNSAPRPRLPATDAGTLSDSGRPSSRACTPTRLKAKTQAKPSTPDQTKALSMDFSSVMKPRSVSTGS